MTGARAALNRRQRPTRPAEQGTAALRFPHLAQCPETPAAAVLRGAGPRPQPRSKVWALPRLRVKPLCLSHGGRTSPAGPSGWPAVHGESGERAGFL